MKRPKGTLTRNSTSTRLNHWFTAACFVLLTISGLSMFYPLLFWMSEFFGGGQWTRAVHPWIGIALLVSYTGLIIQFWRDNLWNRDDLAWSLAIGRVLANEEEGVPAVGRFNAGQKFVFWSMALLIPVLFVTGMCKCGNSEAGQSCARGPRCAADYQARISGPLLDRMWTVDPRAPSGLRPGGFWRRRVGVEPT